jgi:hypothetical protein
MPLPTAQELNPHDDLDGRCARDHFLGKSVEAAEALIREHPLYYQSDLMHMGPIAFRYYLPAIAQFVRSDEADSDFVAHFSSTLDWRFKYQMQELTPVARQVADLCGYIVQEWPRFENAEGVYGDIRATYVRLADACSKLAQKTTGRAE